MKLTKRSEFQLNKIREAGHEVDTEFAYGLWHLFIDKKTYFFDSLEEIEGFIWGYSEAIPF